VVLLWRMPHAEPRLVCGSGLVCGFGHAPTPHQIKEALSLAGARQDRVREAQLRGAPQPLAHAGGMLAAAGPWHPAAGICRAAHHHAVSALSTASDVCLLLCCTRVCVTSTGSCQQNSMLSPPGPK
jgi:hypothetical protein